MEYNGGLLFGAILSRGILSGDFVQEVLSRGILS